MGSYVFRQWLCRNFLSLFFLPTSAYIIIFCSSVLLLQRPFLSLSLSRALNCRAAPSPGAGESWGGDQLHDLSVLPAADLCYPPLLCRHVSV